MQQQQQQPAPRANLKIYIFSKVERFLFKDLRVLHLSCCCCCCSLALMIIIEMAAGLLESAAFSACIYYVRILYIFILSPFCISLSLDVKKSVVRFQNVKQNFSRASSFFFKSFQLLAALRLRKGNDLRDVRQWDANRADVCVHIKTRQAN